MSANSDRRSNPLPSVRNWRKAGHHGFAEANLLDDLLALRFVVVDERPLSFEALESARSE
jgi:hypothetical protein